MPRQSHDNFLSSMLSGFSQFIKICFRHYLKQISFAKYKIKNADFSFSFLWVPSYQLKIELHYCHPIYPIIWNYFHHSTLFMWLPQPIFRIIFSNLKSLGSTLYNKKHNTKTVIFPAPFVAALQAKITPDCVLFCVFCTRHELKKTRKHQCLQAFCQRAWEDSKQ